MLKHAHPIQYLRISTVFTISTRLLYMQIENLPVFSLCVALHLHTVHQPSTLALPPRPLPQQGHCTHRFSTPTLPIPPARPPVSQHRYKTMAILALARTDTGIFLYVRPHKTLTNVFMCAPAFTCPASVAQRPGIERCPGFETRLFFPLGRKLIGIAR